MSPGTVVLLTFLGSVALVAAITLFVFRSLSRRFGLEEVNREGVVLTENGVEVLRFFGIGKTRFSYADVDSVELLPGYLGPFAKLLPRYHLSARWAGTRFFHEMVVIKLRGSRMFNYLICTPNDPRDFAKELRSRIDSQGKK